MYKISIIIPVYNVEKYLSKCLDSIVNQTYKNIEVICINDGSTDNSLKILTDFAQNDTRIKIVNQENLGVSAARNKGLDNAKGDYILFVDSDDWFSLNTCEELVKTLNESPYDLIIFNYNVVTKNIVRPIKCLGGNKFAFWAACYKNNIIKNSNIRFPENIKISEDHIFKYNFLHFAQNIKHHDGYFYYYNITNENSATKDYAKTLMEDIKAYEFLTHTEFYKNSTQQQKLEMTDYWGLLSFGAWAAIPLKSLKKEYSAILDEFLQNYKQFNYKDYKNLIGYKRIKHRCFVRFLKSIRDLFFLVIYRRNK